MGESTGSKRSRGIRPASRYPKPPLPVPQALGFFIPASAILSLSAGILRHELVLSLLGTAFLTVCVYSLLAVLFLAFVHRKRAASLSVRITPETLGTGQMGMLFCDREGSSGGNGRFFRLPGIIIRCALALSTKDGRRLEFFFDPVFTGNGSIPFCAPERGAYYGETDRLLVFDMLGLFHAAIDVPQPSGPRLLVMPRTAEQVLPLPARSGGAGLRTEPRFLRTDNLIDHRPYIPGDDPRRINWKLYGHAGEIFVREGELEPPPHSRIVILIDTQTDYSLYNAEAGRRGVDLLCENALALALDYESRGMDAGIGFSGGGVSFGGPVEMAAVLAHPAALPLSSQGRELPLPDDVQDALVLALPRDWTSGRTERPSGLAPGNTLDAFLKKREGRQKVDLLFLYDGEDAQAARLEKNAEACARFYGGKGGIRAGYIRI